MASTLALHRASEYVESGHKSLRHSRLATYSIWTALLDQMANILCGLDARRGSLTLLYTNSFNCLVNRAQPSPKPDQQWRLSRLYLPLRILFVNSAPLPQLPPLAPKAPTRAADTKLASTLSAAHFRQHFSRYETHNGASYQRLHFSVIALLDFNRASE